jgi:hypothetical protein
MTFCSVLTPAFSVSSYEYHSFINLCSEHLGVSCSDFEVFALVPLKDVQNPTNAVVKFKKSSFSLSSIENLIVQKELLMQQLQISRNALSSYSEKLHSRKSVTVDEKITKKMNKLEEDNKKLRNLLKYFILRNQLDNAENLRIATQKTVENLREEFDLLVRELLSVKKSREKDETNKIDKKTIVPKLKIIN